VSNTLIAVDAEKYSARPDAELPILHRAIRDVMRRACETGGLATAWAMASPQYAGDGLVVRLPFEAAVSLIHPFLRLLQEELAEEAPRLRTISSGLRLRLRVALHSGRVGEDGISTAMNDVHRLLDSEPVRDALRDSDPDVTLCAAIVSAEAFETWVRGGHTRLRPSEFTEVRATVKGFDRPAWLYVPRPSRVPAKDARPPAAPLPSPGTPAPSASTSVTGDGNQVVSGTTVGRDLWQGNS
jgi:class 3 adenylate cyclase